MTPWEVINEVLAHRNPRQDLAWLANRLQFSIQRVYNWKDRGVPTKHYRDVAAALGISIDQLEGLSPLPWENSFPWPFSAALQERVEDMSSEERTELEADIWRLVLKQEPPSVVKEQLRKAKETVERLGLSVTRITSGAETTQKS